MSNVFRDMGSIDTMPSHIEAPSRIFGPAVGKTTFRSRLAVQDRNRINIQYGSGDYMENLSDQRLRPSPLQHAVLPLQSKLNPSLRPGTLVQRSTMSRTFGLQTKNLPPLHTERSLNHQDVNNVQHKSSMSTVSRTFGLIPEDVNGVNTQSNENSNFDLRRINSVKSSVMPRTFGLQTRNVTVHSHFFSENGLRQTPDLDFMNCRRSNASMVVSRTFDLGAEKVGSSGISAHDSEGCIQDFRRNGNINSSLMAKPFGHQSRNLTVHSSLLTEGNSNCKMNGLSTAFEGMRSGIRSSTMIAESGIPERATCHNETIDDGGFRRPTLSRIIRGRNSLLSSRLLHSQNIERHCRDLSNINGFNVSHIGRRDADSLSESRMALNMRSKWMDNQSMTGSILSAASIKGQFMNLLESLHHSILNIGPNVTAEAVRMEFDKAKQGLENMCEMSLPPSVREADAASVITQSSKLTCPPINDQGTDIVIDGGSLHLKSSKEVLKTLVSSKANNRRKFNLSTHAEEGATGRFESVSSSKDSDDEEYYFKKPKPLPKNRKILLSAKTKTSRAKKSSLTVETNKVLSLKQWYPIALGSDLVLCGIDEQGITVKTDPVKKRLSSRKVELVSGLICDLLGNPSTKVSVFPRKITALLKNGLTDRWRVLREELMNYQEAGKDRINRKSKSPKAARSPKKPVASKKAPKAKQRVMCEPRSCAKMKSPRANKGKSKSPKTSTSPKRSGKEILTRSGRAVKPPAMFWMVSGSTEVSSSILETPKSTSAGRSAKKRHKRSNEGMSAKETRKESVGSPRKHLKKDIETLMATESQSGRSLQGKSKKADETSGRRAKGKSPKVKRSKGNQKKGSDIELRVHSSTENGKRQKRGNKRVREIGGDVDAVESKKSKLEKTAEIEIKSIAEDTRAVTKRGEFQKKKGGLAISAVSTKVKAKKSPAKKSNKKTSKKMTVKEAQSENKEGNELNEFEEDFELQLNDIEIPEIANVSGNPQLSRSQLRVVSMETPPLKYFNNNLRLLRSATPLRSPDWCISERTESEVKRFQKRREEAFKKKTRVDVKQTMVTKKATKTFQSKELKRVMEWIGEKTVRSPVWNSKVVQYFLPSRKQLEQQDDDEEDEGGETEFSKPSFG